MTPQQIKDFYNSLLVANPALAGSDSLDWTIRQALESCILAIAPEAIVFPFDCLTHTPDEWANLFTQNGVIHGWVIKRVDVESVWERQTSYQSSYFYDVWGFYGFDPESRTNNSDLKFQKIADLLFLLTAKLPQLGINCGVTEHRLLQFKGMTTLRGGSMQMHWNPGRIEVRLCEMQPGTDPC